jgi:hypothetical protein
VRAGHGRSSIIASSRSCQSILGNVAIGVTGCTQSVTRTCRRGMIVDIVSCKKQITGTGTQRSAVTSCRGADRGNRSVYWTDRVDPAVLQNLDVWVSCCGSKFDRHHVSDWRSGNILCVVDPLGERGRIKSGTDCQLISVARRIGNRSHRGNRIARAHHHDVQVSGCLGLRVGHWHR